MTFTAFLFYFFAVLQVFVAISLITVKNPVHSVLLLVVTFFCGSVLWMLLEMEFLSIVLVLVYVGAVMVLFLFVVMMLDINLTEMRAGFVRYFAIGVPIALALAGLMVWVLDGKLFQVEGPPPRPEGYSNVDELGSVLYTDYFYSFELAAVVLLVAMVAAITLTFRRRPGTRRQDPAQQIKVRREERVRLVKMKSESRS